MASSFKRRSKQTTQPSGSAEASSGVPSPIQRLSLRGTKPCSGGATQTSFGLRDLDAILGGGQPLGSCILVEEDRWTNSLAAILIRYWCAEAVAQDHHILVPTLEVEDCGSGILGTVSDEIDNLRDSLPRNLHWDKLLSGKEGNQDQEAWTSTTLTEIPDGDEDAEDEEAGDVVTGLEPQEKKDKQPQGSSPSPLQNVYCHSYDLSSRLSQQLERMGKPNLEQLFHKIPLKKGAGYRQMYKSILHELMQVTKNQNSNQQSPTVIRLLLFHHDHEALCKVLPLLLAQVRLQRMPVVVLVCLQPWKQSASKEGMVTLRRHADVVLQTEGFASRSHYPPPSELRHLQGLMIPRKVSTCTAATAIGSGHYADITVGKRPASNIFGIKRDRRKLHTVLLHIPPQEQIMEEGRPI